MLNSYKRRDGRDVSVLKYLSKVSSHVSKQKYHFNNLKVNRSYVAEIVKRLENIQNEVRELRKLVWAKNSIISPKKFEDGCPHKMKMEDEQYFCVWCNDRFSEKEYARWKRKYD